MFNSLRRCPASIRWRLVSIAAKSHSQSASIFSRFQAPPSHIAPKSFSSVRTLHHSTRENREYLKQRDAAPFENEPENEPESTYEDAESTHDAEADDEVGTGPATKFIQLGQRNMVDQNIVRTLTQTMGLETMTQVQTMTIDEALKGKDVLAQAKTGTGKTIGFLLPVIQRILQEEPSLSSAGYQKRPARFGDRASDIRALIISPTRELAEQIAEEARKILQGTSMVVQCAVGGTQKGMHLRSMQREGCHILVGTPGRLKDIFSDRQSGVQAPNMSALVLDEADRLLDQGFWPEIQAIQDLLPSKQEKDRQTLMFSATVSSEVVKLVRTVMKPDLHYVRTVQEDEQPTHERVKQMLVTVPGLENLLPTVLELCQREIDGARQQNLRPFKAICYFNATAETTLASSIFFHIRRHADAAWKFLTHTRVYEIHSRLSQHQRTAAANLFRGAESGILMSSDVTARGMDFPGVTHVIQVGIPNSRDTYIHRLGRTARAGQEGQGWLIIPQQLMRDARNRLGSDLPLQPDATLASSKVDYKDVVAGSEPANQTEPAKQTFDAVSFGAGRVQPEELEKTYMGFLGTMQWVHDKAWVIAAMNRLTNIAWGMERPPSVTKALAVKLGIMNVPGVNVSGGARRAFGDEAPSRPPRRFDDGNDRGSSSERGPLRGGAYGERSDRGGFGDRPPSRNGFSDRSSGRPAFGGARSEGGGFGARADRGDRPSFGDRSSGRGGSSDRSGGGSSFGPRDGGGSRSGKFNPAKEFSRGGNGGKRTSRY